MPFPLNQQICTACITVTQLVHSKTASKLAATIRIIIIPLIWSSLRWNWMRFWSQNHKRSINTCKLFIHSEKKLNFSIDSPWLSAQTWLSENIIPIWECILYFLQSTLLSKGYLHFGCQVVSKNFCIEEEATIIFGLHEN